MTFCFFLMSISDYFVDALYLSLLYLSAVKELSSVDVMYLPLCRVKIAKKADVVGHPGIFAILHLTYFAYGIFCINNGCSICCFEASTLHLATTIFVYWNQK